MNAVRADRPLHPVTLVGRFLRRLPEFAIGLPVVVNVAADPDGRTLLLLGALGAALSGVVAILVWLRFRWGVGPAELVIERGVLFRQRRVIPFARVADVDIERGPLARLFGTARVRIETGGASRDEGELNSIALADAQRLRDIIRSGRDGTPAPNAAAEQVAEPLLFAMDLHRVLLAGLLGFSLFTIAFLFAGLQYLQPWIDWDGIDPDRWVAAAAGLGVRRAALAGAALAMILLLLALVAGIVRSVARDYGYRLTRTPEGFRRRRGLLTLSEVVIPRRRIQLALVRSGWLTRLLGWQRLDFQTLGADRSQTGRQEAAPLGRRAEIVPILADAGLPPPPGGGAMIRVSRWHILRQSLLWCLPLAAASIGASFADDRALLWLAAAPLVAIAAALQYRHHRYLVADDALFIRDGILARRLFILPYRRIQSIEQSADPLQRLLGLATVHVDTAGAPQLGGAGIRNLPAPAAAALLPRLLAAHHAASLRARSG